MSDQQTFSDPGRSVYSPILGITRLEFDECKDPAARKIAETEASRDLRKPIEQLLADVHEEAETNPDPAGRIAGANKRMVSLMLKVVRSNNRQAALLLILAVVATIGTLVQVGVGILQLHQAISQKAVTANRAMPLSP